MLVEEREEDGTVLAEEDEGKRAIEAERGFLSSENN